MPTPHLPLNLPQRAFPAQPRLDRYFASSSSESARRRLVQCVLRGDGPALVLGAPGVGKTMLLEVLAADLAPKLKVVRLASTQLCNATGSAPGDPPRTGRPVPRPGRRGSSGLALTDLLADARLAGVALLVDEAQTLPVRLLEELRVLSNVSVGGAPQLRLVLAGTHALDEAFTAPELEAFCQRLVARCYLDPLSRDETAGYVRAHVAAAGGDPDRLLAGDAYEAILRATEGLPRLVNQVADRALVLAAEEGRRQLDAEAISAAWSDLHQLAAPWQAPPASRLAAVSSGPPEDSSSIEFGLLDDDLAAEEPAAVGVWNAGDKLRRLGESSATQVELHAYELNDAEEEDDDTPCVAYAFPGSSRSTDNVDDELLREADSLFEEVAAATRPPKPAARNPFAEDFDEEEVVIDPFAELERVIPAAPEVFSVKSSELSRALAVLEPAAEKPPQDAPERAAATVEALIEAAVAEDDILIVEPDEVPTPAPAARREEYSQLFAKLRQG